MNDHKADNALLMCIAPADPRGTPGGNTQENSQGNHSLAALSKTARSAVSLDGLLVYKASQVGTSVCLRNARPPRNAHFFPGFSPLCITIKPV